MNYVNLNDIFNDNKDIQDFLNETGYRIYHIRNKINNKSYIGKTDESIRYRFLNHPFYSHRDGYYGVNNTYLYNAIKKYGPENFEVGILSKDPEERESKYINEFNSFDEGYNMTPTGEGKIGPGEIWVIKDNERKRIFKTDLNKYEEEGWRFDKRSYDGWSHLTRIWNPTTKQVMGVPKDEVEKYLMEGWKLGSNRLGTKKLIKDGQVIYVPSDEVSSYLNDGWETGKNKGSLGYVCVTSPEGVERMIPRDLVDEYISNGYVYGLKSSTRTESSSKGRIKQLRTFGRMLIDKLNELNLPFDEVTFNSNRHLLGKSIRMVPTYKTFMKYSELGDLDNIPEPKFTEPNVTLVDFTSDAMELLLYEKYLRLSDTDEGEAKIIKDIMNWTEEKRLKEIDYILSTIESSFEFVHFTFSLRGISRALTHQIVRTRSQTGNQHDVSIQQQSQRSVNLQKFNYVTPPAIRYNEEALDEYNKTMDYLDSQYHKLINLGVPVQDARNLMPTGVETSMIIKLDLRTLSHMVQERLCLRAQREIRDVVISMCNQVLLVYPWLEKILRPYCSKNGVCRFENFHDCPVKGTIFNPNTGKPWLMDSSYKGKFIDHRVDKQRSATKDEIHTQWMDAIDDFEAIPDMQKK
jgi:thymidylate synthase (FAD)